MMFRMLIIAFVGVAVAESMEAADAYTRVGISRNRAWARARYRADHGRAWTKTDSGHPGSAQAFAAGHDYSGNTAVSYSFLNRDGISVTLGSSAHTEPMSYSTNVQRRRVSAGRRADALVNLGSGDGYLQHGRYRQAIAAYTKAIREDPEEAEAYYMRGLARAQTGDHLGAEADFAAANRLSRLRPWSLD